MMVIVGRGTKTEQKERRGGERGEIQEDSRGWGGSAWWAINSKNAAVDEKREGAE